MNKTKSVWKNLLTAFLFFGSVGVAQAQNNFTTLQSRINSTSNGSTLTLDRDYVAASGEARLNIAKNITIDLNGHIINRNLSEGKDDGGVFYVNSNYTLTLKDNNPTATHSPEVTYTYIVANDTLTATINGGIIMGGWTNQNGGGILNSSSGKLILNGGTIAKNKSVGMGGGVYNPSGATLTMSGGAIAGNAAESYGGGVCNIGESSIAQFTMTGGRIVGNATKFHGGGVYNDKKARFVMRDSEISGNEANGKEDLRQVYGGGVYNAAYLEITRGKISNNRALNGIVHTFGGGIYACNPSTSDSLVIIITESEVTDNEAFYAGGGIHVSSGARSRLKLIGNTIRGNVVYVAGGGIAINNSTNLKLTLKDCIIANNEANTNGGGFFMDGGNYGMTYAIGNNKIKGNIANYGGGLFLNNTTLELSNDSISDNEARYSGGGVCLGGYHVVFTIKEDLTISGNKAKNGGGVYVGEGIYLTSSILNMKGGTITNNNASQNGGGVYNRDTFTMTDGSVSNNTTTNHDQSSYGGGGVYNEKNFTLTDGTISGNTSAYFGGGVYNNGAFTLGKGTITQNNAREWGGGLYSKASFTIENGTITYNNARSGGGIYYYTGTSSAIMNGGTISHNKATIDGGGVYGFTNFTSGGNISFTMNAGTISHNIAGTNGGGVFFGRNIDDESTFTINSGEITGNTAENGGGIFIYHGTLVLYDCTIASNTATKNGGGVYNNGGTSWGRTSAVTMGERSVIRNNTAIRGGGVYNHGKDAILRLTNGSITDNTATASGGGIYNFTNNNTSVTNATIHMSGGSITGNSAPIAQGIYQDGAFFLSGAPVFAPDNDIYLYCTKTKDSGSGINRVITKAGDINCPDGHLHVTLGVSSNNFYHSRNIVESGNGAVTEADLSLFTFNDKETYNRKILFERYWPNDNGTNLTVIELFSPTWVGIVTEQPSGFAVGNIDSKEDLAWLISYINGYNGSQPHPSVTAVITADVDMGEHEWVPIGTGAVPFKGSFNGQGYTISNLRNTAEYVNPGMFGVVNGGLVKNTFVASSDFVTRPGTGGYYGIIADTLINGGKVIYSEARGTLKASDSQARVGGIIGLVSGSASETHSCISIADLEGCEMGGLVCRNEGSVANSLSYPKFTHSGTASDNIGGLVANNSGTVKNCYLRRDRGNSIAGANYHALTANGIAATNSYSPADYTGTQRLNGKYKYGQTDQMVGAESLLDKLNGQVAGNYATWTRTMASPINNDYPVLALPDFTCLAQVDTVNHLFMEYKPDLNTMIAKYNQTAEGGNICLYKANTTEIGTNNNSNVAVYIGEHVGVLQAANNMLNATVGVTFDNSDASLLGGKPYDWHMFATPLQQPAMGISYADNIAHGYMQDPSPITLEANGYFPTDTPKGSFDFYCYSEPSYHWINFKRNSADHWHEDEPHDNIPYTNETAMERGKGYMMAIDKETVLMNTGILNNADFVYPLSYTETLSSYEAPLRGCNLIGNPYQSYLDFDMLANNYFDTYYIIA